jgi:hypothetical protein
VYGVNSSGESRDVLYGFRIKYGMTVG